MMQKKKIKLVTFAPHPNFGTCLQSYALNTILRKMGHEVEFIYNCRENPPHTWKYYVKQCIKPFLPKKLVKIIKEKKNTNNTIEKSSTIDKKPYILKLPNNIIGYYLDKVGLLHQLATSWKYHKNLQWKKVYKFTFLDGNYQMKRIFTHKQYNEIVNDADLFITGSDQIWNPFCGGYNPMMFLEFVNDGTKCVAYSSSISQQEIHPSIKNRMRTALQKFSHIAVREQRSVDLLSELLNKSDIKLVVDPTYLLSADEWSEFGKNAVIEFEVPKKYIFCYFVGDKRKEVYEKMVQDVKRFTGINDVITLDCYNRDYAYGGGRLYSDAGPYEWVYLLQHASYICMDSFHATVFALKFQKEFVHAMKNEESEIGSQNTRMYDILERYGILYKNYKNDTSTEWQTAIKFNIVNKLIDIETQESMKYLIDTIDE